MLSVRVRIHAFSELDKGALYSVWKTLAGTFPLQLRRVFRELDRTNLGNRRAAVNESV